MTDETSVTCRFDVVLDENSSESEKEGELFVQGRGTVCSER